MKNLTRILVPVDSSAGADRAVTLAADLALATGAVLDVLHVSYFDADTDDDNESWLPASIAGPVGRNPPLCQASSRTWRHRQGDRLHLPVWLHESTCGGYPY